MCPDLPEPEEGTDEQPAPVPLADSSCNTNILEKVLEFLTTQEDKDAWDKKCVDVEDGMVIVTGSNDLSHPGQGKHALFVQGCTHLELCRA